MLAKLVCFALATASASGYIPAAQGVHVGITCDGSGMSPIVGTRYHLPGRDYDLCESEFLRLDPSARRAFITVPPPGGADRRRRAAAFESGGGAARRAGEAPGVVPRRVARGAMGGRPWSPRRRRASGDYYYGRQRGSGDYLVDRHGLDAVGYGAAPPASMSSYTRRAAPAGDYLSAVVPIDERADRPNNGRARRLATVAAQRELFEQSSNSRR